MTEMEERVQSKITELQEELDDLRAEIRSLLVNLDVVRNTWEYGPDFYSEADKIRRDYEQWYNTAYPLVEDYLPDRIADFSNRYEDITKGLEIDMDFIRKNKISSSENLFVTVDQGLNFQSSLLSSIPGRVEAESLKVTEKISNRIVSDELQKAKQLQNGGDIRASGVVAGVALERHLLTRCESSDKELEFGYMDGISSLAQTLSNAGEISDDDERLLEYLGGIRNKCAHASEEDPRPEEVDRMIAEINEFIRV